MAKEPFRINNTIQTVLLLLLACGLLVLQGILPQQATGIKGILSQLNVIISVYLVVSFGNLGFFVALAINALQFIAISIIYIFASHNLNTLPGMIIPITTIVIARIIRGSNIRLASRNEEIERQNTILQEQASVLKHMAYYDELTSAMILPAFLQKVTEICIREKESGSIFALVIIDLDNFKNINDSMGHATGDEVLRSVAKRLMDTIHPQDTLGRIGGDEFALLIPRHLDQEPLANYLSTLFTTIKAITLQNDIHFRMQVSAGVAYYPTDANNASELLQCADIAIYKAKLSGKNRIMFFTSEMRKEMERTIRIEQHLMQAIDKKEFTVFFQPQYNINDHKTIGLEALLRWTSPELGSVGPSVFIPIAERCGMINKIGKWVLKEACKLFMVIKEDLPEGTSISINVSPVQLVGSHFIKVVETTLKETGLPAHDLTLEITESALIADSDHALRLMHKLVDMGIRLALDDFGKGYSSLHYMHEMPLDTLKIDRDYIWRLNQENQTNALVSTIINLAHHMGYQVIAEGVETQEQLTTLQDMQCDGIQGYLWGKPMPFDEVKSIIIG